MKSSATLNASKSMYAKLCVWIYCNVADSSYASDTDDEIQIDGMIKFCEAIEVDPSDKVMLVLAWKFKGNPLTLLCLLELSVMVNVLL